MKEARCRPKVAAGRRHRSIVGANVLKVLRRPQAPPPGGDWTSFRNIAEAAQSPQSRLVRQRSGTRCKHPVRSTNETRRDDTLKSITRPAYGGFQLLLLLRPTDLFGARPFVQRSARLLDARGSGVVLAFSFFKRSFRICHCLFAPTTFLFSRRFFLAPRHFAPFLLSLESDSSRARGFRMYVAWRQIFWLRASFCWLVLDRVARQRLRQAGVLAERFIRPDRAPQNESWLCHGGGNDRGVARFLGKPLFEDVGS